MKPEMTPLRSSRLWDSAREHAEELASASGKPAIIYYRPIDDHWFVLCADAGAPKGRTIKTTVYPGSQMTGRIDPSAKPIDGVDPASVLV